jgi:hypothetical protein
MGRKGAHSKCKCRVWKGEGRGQRRGERDGRGGTRRVTVTRGHRRGERDGSGGTRGHRRRERECGTCGRGRGECRCQRGRGQAEKGPGRPPKGEPIGRRHLPPQTVHQAWHAYLIAHRSPPAWVLIGARRDTRVQEEGKGARDMGAGGVPLQLNKGTLIILASLS